MQFLAYVGASFAIAVATMAGTLLISRARWQWFPVTVALVGATGLLLLLGLAYYGLTFDDSYITFRYSRNLADGLGPNWNSVGRVEGYTNFLWMALLAGTTKAGLDIVVMSRVLAILAIAATFLSIHGIWKLWGDEERGSGIESPVLLAAVLVGLALTDGVGLSAVSGMETALFMALLTGGAYLYFLECRSGRFPWSAVALAAAAMTRPEGLIAVVVTGAFMMANVVRGSDQKGALRRYLAWAGLFLILYGTYFLWRYSYYDYLLPNTFYAKVGLTRAVFDRGLIYVWTSGLQYQLLALIAGTAILFTRLRIRRDGAYIMVLCSSMLAGIVFEGGDFFPHGRFVVPLLPLLYLGGLAGFATLLPRLKISHGYTVLVVAVFLSLAGLSLIRGSYESGLAFERKTQAEGRMFADWVSEYVPESYTIATISVGLKGYYSERDILDMLGLNDVVIAHTKIPGLGTGAPAHEKYNIDYVLDEARPEIILATGAQAHPFTEKELRQELSTPSFVQARNLLFDDPRLWERYAVRSVNIEGLWFSFFQREDTVAQFQAPGLQ